MNEIWKPVKGYEGYYEVSNEGRVRGLDRYVKNPAHGKNFQIHRLVLETFVGECPEGMECCHYDDDCANNNLSNLRWDTHENNVLDRIRNNKSQKGSRNYFALFDEEEVSAIKWALSHSFRQADVARYFDVSPSVICYIATNKTWRHTNAY